MEAGVLVPLGLDEVPVGVEVPATEVPATEVPASEVPASEATLVPASDVPGAALEVLLPSPPQDANKSAAERIKTCERLFFIKKFSFFGRQRKVSPLVFIIFVDFIMPYPSRKIQPFPTKNERAFFIFDKERVQTPPLSLF